MSSRYILLGLIAVSAFTSCSIYREGQTPDDVYYSPGVAVEADSYVSMDRGNRYRQNDNADDYAYSDYWLRMRVSNPYRWSTFYDYDMYNYGYNSLGYGSYGYSPYGYGFNNYWNNYYYWNSYYNPYCGQIIALDPKNNPGAYSRVRSFSLASYNNTSYNNRNAPAAIRNTRPASYQNYNNANTTNSIRRTNSNSYSGRGESYYTPSNGRSGGSTSTPVRAYTPSNQGSTYTPPASTGSSSAGSSGSRGSSGSTGSRPGRN